MNYLVETKVEFTTHLENILIPIIHEGISSIYETAKQNTSKADQVLVTFQTLLKQIPQWNQTLLDQETKRCLTISNCPELLNDLIKAIIKAHIMILTNTPPQDKSKLKINFTMKLHEFIHLIYIETARSIYANPFLYYHDMSLYDLKRNQRDAMEVIRNSIREAIRKMLPLKLILKEYLGNSFKDTTQSEIDRPLPEEDRHNLNGLLNANLGEPENYVLVNINNKSIPKNGSPKNDEPNPGKKTEFVIKSDKPPTEAKPAKNEVEEDSVSYYKRPTVEDTFSNNNASVKRIVVPNKTNPSKDSYTIDITDNGTDIESIRKKLGERYKKNAPEFHKI